MGNKIITPEFRGSYCNLLTPRAPNPESDPVYSILIVLPKKSADTKRFIKQLEKEIAAASLEKHGKVIPASKLKHYPIKDGDDEEDDGFHGHWLVRASNSRKPEVIDRKRNTLFEEEDVYSGAWYRVTVDVWAWDNPVGGKGCSINLRNVLKVKDDEPFTSRAKAEDDFNDVLDDDDAEDDDDDGLLD